MRKRTRRKVWPKLSGLAIAIAGASMMDDERLTYLRTVEALAIEAFRTGTATVDHWRAIADVVNMAETLAGMGVGRDEVMPAVQLAQTHLEEANERFQRLGRIATTGPGLQAFVDLAEFHDLQRTSVDLSTYERAVQRAVNRVRSAHPDIKVCVSHPSPSTQGAPA